ncbi:S8/S53 family peptidase [uncultured Aquimarina sp.]|uniref:S8 family peptidase n=1 Tax=uncultured Aquimarina sp. TaxID=575652 RepID=UPI002618BAA8|nr:S8/S53 family peptidase [uncultured Aquimarina sp.]
MKKIISLILVISLLLSCSNESIEDSTNLTQESNQKLLSVEKVNDYIATELKENGDLDWTKVPALVLWSAAIHSNGVITIGYGNEDENFSENRSPELIDAKANILDVVNSIEQSTKSNTVQYDDDILNFIEVKVSKLETIIALQKTDKVRYIEPSYSSFLPNDQERNFGCATEGRIVNPEDYRIITPNAWLPWSFDVHNIPAAWEFSTGRNITVGVVDSGISQTQKFLGEDFNDGFSNGRTVEQYGTFDGSVYDDCGHGTAMSAAIASPRNDDAMPVGVAYNSNLVVYRGTGDVLLEGSKERKAVSKAIRELGDRSDVKIISMSIGWVWTVRNIKDAVKYAYSKDKMIIAAGGTSTQFTNWYAVIFPASMKETVAVTGIKENGKRCFVCHDGKKIDFTVAMERDAANNRTLPVLGFSSDVRNVVGGSSIATATTAGIAALVWATNPNMTREQVLDKMQKAGEYYPNRSNKYGYGKINVLKAVQ